MSSIKLCDVPTLSVSLSLSAPIHALTRTLQVITKTPHYLQESDSVLQAAKMMKEHNMGAVPIVDDNRRPCGMLTDRDLAVRCIAENQDYGQCQVWLVYLFLRAAWH